MVDAEVCSEKPAEMGLKAKSECRLLVLFAEHLGTRLCTAMANLHCLDLEKNFPSSLAHGI